MKEKPTFWSLMQNSTITSGILAVVIVVVMGYCAVCQIPVPQYMVVALGTIIGFFFSSKAKDGEIRNVNARIDRVKNGQ